MDMEQEMRRLQGVEREYMEYLRAQCESVGADTNVEGLENPKLALACRYALADPKISLRDHFAAAALPALVATALDLDHVKWDATAEHAYIIADAMLKERKQ